MKRAARFKQGSVVYNRRYRTWNFLWFDGGRRRSRKIGSLEEFPTKAAACRAAASLRESFERAEAPEPTAITVRALVAQYRHEKMPSRQTTKRGYESWIENRILPEWGDHPISDLQPRPVELWLKALPLSGKSKLHIRGLLSILWDYAMWRGDVPTQRNPMELVTVKGATKRVRCSRSLTPEEFHKLLDQFRSDTCMRTMLLVAVSFGLRISEVLGLKWKDVDWLNKTLRVERGVVKQIVEDVKTAKSAATMVIADELVQVLNQWKRETQFSGPEDWIFASPAKLGRQPLSYTHVWYSLDSAAQNAGIGHISSHAFRHTHRTWLDSVGTPVGVQQRLMRHADIRTTMNTYGDALPDDLRNAHQKVVGIALSGVN